MANKKPRDDAFRRCRLPAALGPCLLLGASLYWGLQPGYAADGNALSAAGAGSLGTGVGSAAAAGIGAGGMFGQGLGGGQMGFGNLGGATNPRGGWVLRPYFMGGEIFSDNVFLAPDNEALGTRRQDGFVTQINPGISVRHTGRSRFQLNYRMQNLFYAGPDINPRSFHQLQMNSYLPLWEKSVFLNASATVGQMNNTTSAIQALDTVSRTSNVGTYRTFRVNPYWRPHFANYADAIVRLGYANVNAANNSQSNIFDEMAMIQSGDWFDTLAWRGNFHSQNTQRSGGTGNNNVSYQNYNGEIRLRLTEALRPFIQAGNYNNNFGSTTQTGYARNGSYWTAGFYWFPGRRFALQAGYGSNNYLASLRWSPSRRTNLQLTFRHSAVGGFGGYGGYGGGGYGGSGSFGGSGSSGFGGSNFGGYGSSGFGGGSFGGSGGSGFGGSSFGGFGSSGFGGGSFGGYGSSGFGGGGFGQLGGSNAGTTWSGLFLHRTRRTQWTAMYGVQTTTLQQVLLTQSAFTAASPSLNDQNLPSDQVQTVSVDQPGLDAANDVLTRKRAQIGVALFASKSRIGIFGYQESRRYELSSRKQDVLGASAYWQWRLSTRVSSLVYLTWQSTDGKNQNNSGAATGSALNTRNDLMFMSVRMNRHIWENLMGSLEFRHVQQSSNNATAQYHENRVTGMVYLWF